MGTSTQYEPYLKATTEQKAIVAKYAAEHSVTKAIRRFSGDFGLMKALLEDGRRHILARIALEEEVWFQHGGKQIEREEEWMPFNVGRRFG